MAWIMLVQGINFKIVTPDPYALEHELESDPSYAALKSAAQDKGLLLNSQSDTDEDNAPSVFIGKELHADRHIYCGQTIVAETDDAHDDQTASLAETLRAILMRTNTQGFEEKSGIVLSQFD